MTAIKNHQLGLHRRRKHLMIGGGGGGGQTDNVKDKILAGLAVFLCLVLQYCVAISCKLCMHNYSVSPAAVPLLHH